MKLPTKAFISELSAANTGPCISMYLPTHRSHPDNAQDPIRFQNLIKQLESSLSQKYSADEVKEFIRPFENVKDDRDVWNHNLDGLAVFSADDVFHLISLPVQTSELVVVADSFHTKPLRNYLQTVDRFQILSLNLHEMRLFEGNRHSISEIELGEDIPKTLQEALGEELTEKHITVASYGGVGGEGGNMHHGHGGKKDETDIDAERFFRVVADTVHENFSKPSGLPLILAALPEHHSLFRKVSRNPFLLSDGILSNPQAFTSEQLRTKAWEVMEPEYNAQFDTWSDKVCQAIVDQKGSDLISDIVAAATSGRIETLLLESDKIIPGKIVEGSDGQVKTTELSDPEVDDLLDDISEIVVKFGGEVIIVPAEKMPVQTGAAAIFRY
ncbi:baeRF3 domain-containing protein [Dyadobacter crusticola]|uniref:baeRF3 domain-containing protein n=1 Tax=Dyadobacter crusticola TaxID=292407 RepID=UPI0006908EF7|nr:hypothetical protein [Dyadobacter crusticola]